MDARSLTNLILKLLTGGRYLRPCHTPPPHSLRRVYMLITVDADVWACGIDPGTFAVATELAAMLH
jgi:hypothetical protein